MRPGYVADMGEKDPDGDLIVITMEFSLDGPPKDSLEGFEFLQGTICDFR